MTGKTKNSKEYNILHENKDYLLVEDAIKVLKIQLAQAEKDIRILKEYKEKALADPIGFVENLINKKYKNIPRLQKVISIPNIDLSIYQPHSLRHAKTFSNSNNSTQNFYKEISYSEDTSPTSPDYLWNLLEIFPEESVPMTRYVKISNQLETKSPKQVEKKVQTLSKRRRTTRRRLKPQKIATESKIKAEKTLYSNRFSGAIYLSTPTVYMSDEEEDGAALLGTGSVSMTSAAATATVDPTTPNSTNARSRSRRNDIIVKDDDSSDEDYQEPVSRPRRNNSTNNTSGANHSVSYMTRSSSLPSNSSSLRSKAKDEKKKKQNNIFDFQDINNIHHGIQCDRCGIEPIVGIRYKCKVCEGDNQVDLCEDCISKDYENAYHKANHEFERIDIYIPEDDRTAIASENYSYLGFSRQL
ncbi:hypothetical protein BCR32DRAFT_268489 [Anaeromyces robustus]|uniref:ZZ-type domain-containing protein n=1 Tax=Anaeromyces robustus TaxID=1754192 RepID=A0A1Y1X5Z7_9FUNG|nr:hypothetical protein BCR32DRAFT_268489 [Anaeromyces robustus]|eukprot:ORX81095.1 hypothetical protein BCR32DRAFT_268489 [Anaeromyces robustus]